MNVNTFLRPCCARRLSVRTTASPISRIGTSVGLAGGSLAERHDAHQHGAANEQTERHGSVRIRVPVNDSAARTRHPDAIALDAAVEIAAVRGSGASINHFECKIADPLRYRQGRSVGVDHRGWYAVREQSRSTGSERDELVEVHHAKP